MSFSYLEKADELEGSSDEDSVLAREIGVGLIGNPLLDDFGCLFARASSSAGDQSVGPEGERAQIEDAGEPRRGGLRAFCCSGTGLFSSGSSQGGIEDQVENKTEPCVFLVGSNWLSADGPEEVADSLGVDFWRCGSPRGVCWSGGWGIGGFIGTSVGPEFSVRPCGVG